MEEKNVYTMEQWAKDGTFKAKPGQFVEESIYWQMLNCVPPRSCSRGYMQVDEADGTCPKTGRDTYATICGICRKWNGNAIPKTRRTIPICGASSLSRK